MNPRARSIRVPLTFEASNSLELGISSGQTITWNVTEEEFHELWKSQALEELRRISGKLIDDFEEDSITGEFVLRKCSQVIEKKINTTTAPLSLTVLRELYRLLEIARAKDTAIFFFF